MRRKYESFKILVVAKTNCFFCSIAVLTVLLTPMVIIGFYDHPSYDDFGYAALTVKAYREHSSIIAAALK